MLVVAVLCNGVAAFLKRTGLLDREAYKAYWTGHCLAPSLAHEWQCRTFTSRNDMELRRTQPPLDAPDADFSHLYEAPTWTERGLKLVKDLLWLALLAPGAWLLARGGQGMGGAWRAAAPALALAAYAGASALVSAALHGPWIALAGVRGCIFVALALLGAWLADRLASFARAAAAVLAMQAALVPFELVLGLHVFREWTPLALAARAAGTMVQPNSLGVLAVCAFAFWYCFSPNRAGLRWLAAAAVLLVLASGSGTGVVCAIALALVLWGRRARPRPRHIVLALAGAALAAMVLLPLVTGRADVLASVFQGGRLKELHEALSARPPGEVLWGSGLGVRTNLAVMLDPGDASSHARPTDSALVGFLVQTGLVGTALFYGLLAWAARRDAQARPFYAAALLCSLTINLTEVFPVSVLLGLALAHSIWSPRLAGEGRGG